MVAVVGATGFVGRRLARRLAGAGMTVRCLARRPDAVERRPGLVPVAADLRDIEGLTEALRGAAVAYYLVHNLEAEGEFAALERTQASVFGRACRGAGVARVIYLGGLYPDDQRLSQHLASRREVGEILIRECGALVIRAGIIIGSGSASFEIMRDLARRLPAMVAPRWVANRCQSIYVDDVLETLVRAIEVPGNREVDIAGPDILTYGEMLKRLGREMGRQPVIVPVPVLSPQLSSRWLRFITAVPLPVAKSLVNSLRNEALTARPDLCQEVGVEPRSFVEAVRATLAGAARTRLSEEASSSYAGGRVRLRQTFEVGGVEWRCDLSLLGRIDAAVFRTTARAVPFLRWTGFRLVLGGITLVAFTPLRPASGTTGMSRGVTGGLLAAREGGELTFACAEDRTDSVTVGLEGYAPRLPRFAYRRLQEPLHRRLVRAAVATVAREQS
jgi:uncharacterized protein YbjT (DUF2867 family)